MQAAWKAHRRSDDGELLGFVVPAESGYDVLTVFGYRLATLDTERDAEEVLDRTGLDYLTDRWTFHSSAHGPIQVLIVEASPTRVVLSSNDYGVPIDIGTRFTLGVPTGDLLTR